MFYKERMDPKQYPQHLQRLKEEQEKGLNETDEKIKQWQSFESDYKALKNRLKTLPDKLTHDVMVPFGKMAFMPGQLVHTNEVLVLLGDNWFVDRSAKQASEIVERRVTSVDKQLEDLYQQRRLLEPRRDFTAELQDISQESGGVLDIREEYDEEKEKQWKEDHKMRVRKHKQTLKQQSDTSTLHKKATPVVERHVTDEELWQRLYQLEQQETEGREMQKLQRETSSDQNNTNPEWNPWSADQSQSQATQNKTPNQTEPHRTDTNDLVDRVPLDHVDVQHSASNEDEDESSYSASDEQDSDDYEEDTPIISTGKVIHFTHSPQNSQQDPGANPDHPTETYTSPDTTRDTSPDHTQAHITTPADIYSKFNIPGPTSILKKPRSETRNVVLKKTRKPLVAFDTGSDSGDAMVQESKPKTPSPYPAAFTGTIVEKLPTELSSSSSQQPSKPVSKFKSRTANQNTDNIPPVTKSQSTVQQETEPTKPVSRFKAQRKK